MQSPAIGKNPAFDELQEAVVGQRRRLKGRTRLVSVYVLGQVRTCSVASAGVSV